MALTADDYIDIVNSIIDCISLNEQQESARLINEKLNHLKKTIFDNNSKKQKEYAKIIYRLRFAKERLLYKSTIVEPLLKDTWELLASKVNDELLQVRKLKKEHPRL